MDMLFLIKKGVKARKKRLAAGGGGGGGLVGTKLIAFSSKSHPSIPSNYSSVEMNAYETLSGAIYVDPITGHQITTFVADMVAHQNGLVSSPVLTNGTINLSVGTDFTIEIFAFLHSTITGSGTETAAITALTDVGGNWSAGHITVIPAVGSLTSPYNSPYGGGFTIMINGAASAGETIIKLSNPNGGADTDSNVIAGSASVSDAYHLKIVLS